MGQAPGGTTTTNTFTTTAGGVYSAWVGAATYQGPGTTTVRVSTTTGARALAVDNLTFYP